MAKTYISTIGKALAMNGRVLLVDGRAIRPPTFLAEESPTTPPTSAVMISGGKAVALSGAAIKAPVFAPEINEECTLLSASVRSKKAGLGKAFTFTIYSEYFPASYVAVYENGKEVKPRVMGYISPAKLKNKKVGWQLSINAKVRGDHDYTFVLFDPSGRRSANSKTLTVTVR